MNYESKLKTTSIRFTSRASIKIQTKSGDRFFTVEACEERMIPEGVEDVDWSEERKLLWDTVNDECDEQIKEVINIFKN